MTNDEKGVFVKIFGIIGSIIALIIIVSVVSGKVEEQKYREEDKKMYNEIKYEVPDELENDSDLYHPWFSKYERDYSCFFTVYANKKEYYDSMEEYLKTAVSANIGDEVSEIEELEFQEKMYSVSVTKKKTSEVDYYYVVESKNYYYELKYHIMDYQKGDRDDIDTNVCYTSKDKILKTILTKH